MCECHSHITSMLCRMLERRPKHALDSSKLVMGVVVLAVMVVVAVAMRSVLGRSLPVLSNPVSMSSDGMCYAPM